MPVRCEPYDPERQRAHHRRGDRLAGRRDSSSPVRRNRIRIGRRELGHLHGDVLADFPFPRAIRDELVTAGRVSPHHVLPDSGWVSFRIRSSDDVTTAVDLFKLAYDRASAARSRRQKV